jgi:hypothetical protein
MVKDAALREREEVEIEIGDAMRFANSIDASDLSHDQLLLMLSVLMAAVGDSLDKKKPLTSTFFDATVLACRKSGLAGSVISTRGKLYQLVEARLRPLREARESDSIFPVDSSQHKQLIAQFKRLQSARVPLRNIPARVHAELMRGRVIEKTVHISSTRRALQRAGLIPKPTPRKK